MMSMKDMMAQMIKANNERDPKLKTIFVNADQNNLGIRCYSVSGDFMSQGMTSGAAYKIKDERFFKLIPYRNAIIASIKLGINGGSQYVSILRDLPQASYDPYSETLEKIGALGGSASVVVEFPIPNGVADTVAGDLADLIIDHLFNM